MQLKGKIDKRNQRREMKTQRARKWRKNHEKKITTRIRELKYCLQCTQNEATLTFNYENKSHTNSSECIQFFMQDSRQRQQNSFLSKGEEVQKHQQ